eukprot:gene26403-32980_t
MTTSSRMAASVDARSTKSVSRNSGEVVARTNRDVEKGSVAPQDDEQELDLRSVSTSGLVINDVQEMEVEVVVAEDELPPTMVTVDIVLLDEEDMESPQQTKSPQNNKRQVKKADDEKMSSRQTPLDLLAVAAAAVSVSHQEINKKSRNHRGDVVITTTAVSRASASTAVAASSQSTSFTRQFKYAAPNTMLSDLMLAGGREEDSRSSTFSTFEAIMAEKRDDADITDPTPEKKIVLFTDLSSVPKILRPPLAKPVASSRTSSTKVSESLQIINNIADYPEDEIVSAFEYLCSCCQVPAQLKKLVVAGVLSEVIGPNIADELVKLLLDVVTKTTREATLFQSLWALRLLALSDLHVVAVLDGNIFGLLHKKLSTWVVASSNVLVQALQVSSVISLEAQEHHQIGLTLWFDYVVDLLDHMTVADLVIVKEIIEFLRVMLSVVIFDGFKRVTETAGGEVVRKLAKLVTVAPEGQDGAHLVACIIKFFQHVVCNKKDVTSSDLVVCLLEEGEEGLMLGALLTALERRDDLTGRTATEVLKVVINYSARLEGGNANLVRALVKFRSSSIFTELNVLLSCNDESQLSDAHMVAISSAAHILMLCCRHADSVDLELLVENLFALRPMYDILYFAVQDAQFKESQLKSALPWRRRRVVSECDILIACKCLVVVVAHYANSQHVQFADLAKITSSHQRGTMRTTSIWECVEILADKKAVTAQLRQAASTVLDAITAAKRGEKVIAGETAKKSKFGKKSCVSVVASHSEEAEIGRGRGEDSSAGGGGIRENV